MVGGTQKEKNVTLEHEIRGRGEFFLALWLGKTVVPKVQLTRIFLVHYAGVRSEINYPGKEESDKQLNKSMELMIC